MSAIHNLCDVSIRAPARGATAGIDAADTARLFRSALPRGERRCRSTAACAAWSCFDPRSRAGSDLLRVSGIWFVRVSIRAPARGATGASCLRHAASFDPRSRAGSDALTSRTCRP